MSSTFEEKTAWIQLISTILVLGGYFVVSGLMMSAGVWTLATYAPVFAVTVVLLVAVMIAGFIIVSIADPKSLDDGVDERDRIIGWRAEARSGWIVAVGVIAGITGMVFGVADVWIAHLLLGSLFLSTVVGFILQIIDYRRGF